MIAAVAAIFLLAYIDLKREQARALDDFTAEQATLAESFAATVGARIDGVLRDLDAAADHVDHPQTEDTLRRLVAAGELYREVDVIDRDGRATLEIPSRGDARLTDSPPLVSARAALLGAVEQAAVGTVVVSAPLHRSATTPERLRLFAVRRGDRAVLLLVDTDRFFEGMRPVAADAGSAMRWIVVDDAGRWIVFGAPVAGMPGRWQAEERPATTEIANLLASMRTGSRGAVFLGHEAADSLGLGRRSAVAGFAPILVRRTNPWSVSVVTSAMRVRDRARLAALRLGAATGLTSLLVGLFGVVVARQRRREDHLADALKLSEATSALRERSEKIVDVIPLGVLALDQQMRVTSVNPYLVDRGARPGETLRQVLTRATPEEIASLEALVEDARKTRRPAERLGLRLHLGTDDLRDIDAYAIPLGRPLSDVDSFVVLHDRTETRVLERNLVRAEKLATIGTLAAGFAHEVGTPLGIISGRAEQLLGRVPPGEGSEAVRKGLSSILSQVDKVSTTIRQLLDFARIRPIEAAVVTPAQLLGNAAALLEHRFRHAKVNLKVDAPLSVPSITADPGQLEQVFVNLLMNACDACSAGGHVEVRAARRLDRVTFEIIDDGTGIAPEHLPAVLDPFFTTKKRGQGTGLGLTIAADIVRNHGGALEIESAVGRGTTVRVLLPVALPTGAHA